MSASEPDRDRTFAGIEAEDFSRVGACNLDKAVGAIVAAAHACMPHHRHSIFDAGHAVRDLVKAFSAQLLAGDATFNATFEPEGAVVGGNRLQAAVRQRLPEDGGIFGCRTGGEQTYLAPS